MKRLSFFLIISAALMLATAPAVTAQSTMAQKSTAGVTKTTHTNADTSYHSIDLGGEATNYDLLTIQLTGTKTSGTVGGTAVPYGSLDNSRWFQLYDKDSVSSKTLANSNNEFVWQFDKTRFRYYRMIVITTGTQVSAYTNYLLGRKIPR